MHVVHMPTTCTALRSCVWAAAAVTPCANRARTRPSAFSTASGAGLWTLSRPYGTPEASLSTEDHAGPSRYRLVPLASMSGSGPATLFGQVIASRTSGYATTLNHDATARSTQ
ncbi:hypothetical protein GGS23DRAFT_130884 [Durotheca rogersii]|uniref:uncharacterized protein n=1 Tax=Durotheca rogersii TaxID=419775 RepID=UPI00221FE478|nr:uncharacterized protein GGS23DRAFT_130884 [Durotheca rogersii]KAI5861774.1 hypothetical protein GGS23DRAFT_130884 [Durotheca rogersii]